MLILGSAVGSNVCVEWRQTRHKDRSWGHTIVQTGEDGVIPESACSRDILTHLPTVGQGITQEGYSSIYWLMIILYHQFEPTRNTEWRHNPWLTELMLSFTSTGRWHHNNIGLVPPPDFTSQIYMLLCIQCKITWLNEFTTVTAKVHFGRPNTKYILFLFSVYYLNVNVVRSTAMQP